MTRPTAIAIALAAIVAGCAAEQAQQPSTSTPAASAALSPLASSTPADGAVVAGPVNTIELHFSRPARLDEVTVDAGDGTLMPMMVTAVGEVLHYELPVPGLGQGKYRVRWRASAAGTAYQGEFGFQVR